MIGRGLAIQHDVIDLIRERYRRFGSVSWTGMLGTRSVLVVGPDAIEVVVNNRDKAFANGPGWEYFIGPFFNRGIMLLDFEEHLQHKQIMQQAFTRDMLRRYSIGLDAGITRGIATWQPGPNFALYDAVKQLLLDLATEVFVGAELGAQSDRINEAFVDTVVAGLSIVRANVPGGGWHRGLTGRALLEEYFRELLPAKRVSTTDDLMSVLCRAETPDGVGFSDDDIVNHMIFVLMAAHDTTTITSTTMAYYLGKHPEWQERLRTEVRNYGKSAIGYDDLEHLPLLDRVFREALRINPPVGLIMREAVKDTDILGQYVPAGTKLMVALIGTHRLPEFWSKPDEFDPDRFAPHRREDRAHPFLWSPFGGGVHKCIGLYFGGLQAKTILYQLLRNYRWSVARDYAPPMEYGTGLHPGDGLPVTLERLGSE
ncbi:cytochrome P450 [Antrihabitans sp. YC2-6]|uniref:cytochrome P450 n=1 Tax=Antrihabitans sp. YC2-6 TaxID=2799498 RepID=UPI0018F6FE65|nr:cytochrome P450 [Antrihabitans sp. YC2-6]